MLQEAEITITVQDEEQAQVQAAFERLMQAFKMPLTPADERIMRDAFDLARNAHSEQRRKSGEPYILHPIEVARICVEEIGLGPTAAACALMHDVVEDTSISLDEIREQFGDRITRIVEGLTKLDEMKDKESPQAENISKVLKAMLFDVRVVLIKMADRLHNLRTINSMAPSKQRKIAAETSTIYAPLAHRLGLNAVKTEFQDICLKISHPEEYHDIAEQLAQTKRARKEYIDIFTEPLQKALKEVDIEARITGRPKSIYSIWNKIRSKNVPFDYIFELFAIRIIILTPRGAEERLLCCDVYL
ncbi:MAG: HD domain-containing protein, partial [Saprospiraceae bacterium]|nr:HD domain-containing protein [Saprospiraceae bacterium]